MNSEDYLKSIIKGNYYDLIWGRLNILMIGVGAAGSLIGGIYILVIDFNRALFMVDVAFVLCMAILALLWHYRRVSRARVSLIMATYTYFIFTPAIWCWGGVFAESAPYFALMFTLINVVMLSGLPQKIYLALYILIVSSLSVNTILMSGARGLPLQALIIRYSAFILTLLVAASIALYTLKHFDKMFIRNIDLLIKDKLTGMLDRRVFDTVVEIVESGYIKQEENYYFVMLDIDNFKVINDRYGHLAGDTVLRGTAECIMENVRGTDFVFRYGGDEILFVFPGITAEGAEALIRRIEAKAGEQVNYDFDLTFSYGYAARSECGGSQEMLVLADRRMYGKRSDRKS